MLAKKRIILMTSLSCLQFLMHSKSYASNTSLELTNYLISKYGVVEELIQPQKDDKIAKFFFPSATVGKKDCEGIQESEEPKDLKQKLKLEKFIVFVGIVGILTMPFILLDIGF